MDKNELQKKNFRKSNPEIYYTVKNSSPLVMGQ